MTEMAPRVARPPREWEVQTLALMAAVGLAALLGILLLVTDLAARSYVLTGGVDGVAPLVGWVVGNIEALSGLYLLLLIGYVAGFVFWRRSTRELMDSVGRPGAEVVDHWMIFAWYFGLAASFMIERFVDPTGGKQEDVAIGLLWDAAAIGARLIGLAFLLMAVWLIRERVRGQVARSGAVLRAEDAAPRRSVVPLARTASPAAAPEEAGDDFWRRVAGLATGMRADIALLETTEAGVRRWLLVPESGVRPVVTPGAVVTAFPEPPAATETKGFAPRPAGEYHGLLDDGETLGYESVAPRKVGAFLARARRARRWALYPADLPEALTAVVPSGGG